ncbi:MAG: hypothetical protein KDE63_13285, partial [Novosphingobium sp.]|nr:hypothetical protein [Novosphingobium sp.]
ARLAGRTGSMGQRADLRTISRQPDSLTTTNEEGRWPTGHLPFLFCCKRVQVALRYIVQSGEIKHFEKKLIDFFGQEMR